MRPLPRFSGVRARIGTDIHSWIERRASGQGTLIELDEPPDLTLEELAGDPGSIERLRDAYLKSRFADVVPLWAERPFLLRLEGFPIRGRIDAIFGELDGSWEIVDWKTGRMPADPLQLDLYGLACVDIWHKRPEDVTLTYLYLATGEEVSQSMGDAREVRARVTASLKAIEAGSYEPTPGPQCTHCDFRPFCDSGTAWLTANA